MSFIRNLAVVAAGICMVMGTLSLVVLYRHMHTNQFSITDVATSACAFFLGAVSIKYFFISK